VVLSAVLWKDRITKRKLAALVLAFLGCTFVSGVWGGSLELTAQGLLLGLASGFFYGLYSIFGRYALAHYKSLTVTYYTFVFAGLSALFIAPPLQVASAVFSGRLVLPALGMVVISTVLPYILYTRGLARVESGKASILASVEPVVASLVGVAAFGEPLTAGVVLGLACILISVYILR